MESELNKRRTRRYNIVFNLLIFLIILVFFSLFIKVYNDYKDAQINEFVDYSIQQVMIVAHEIEKKYESSINEIHFDIKQIPIEEHQQKFDQIQINHPEIEVIFTGKDLKTFKAYDFLQSEQLAKELEGLFTDFGSDKEIVLSDTIFQQGNIFSMVLSKNPEIGYVLSVFNFKNLVQNIMQPISFERHRGAYILDEKANILYHYQPEMVGKNVFKDFESTSLKDVHQKMIGNETGYGFYVLDWILGEDIAFDKITVWNTFTVGNKVYKVAKAAELEEMNKALTKLRNSGMILIVLIFTTLSVLSLLNLKFQTRLLRLISDDLKEQVKRKTKEIKENEETLKSYIENSQDLVFHIDESLMIEYVSPSVKAILGYTTNEMIHEHLIHYFDQENSIKITSLKVLSEFIRTKGLISPMITKDGFIIDIEWSISSGNYKGGQVYQLIGRDVTEKLKSQKKLKKTAEFRRELLEFSASVLDGSLAEIPYQEILERTLKYIGGGKKGSILVKSPDERYRFIASHGYNRELLEQIYFVEEELHDSKSVQPEIKTAIDRNRKLDTNTLSLLIAAGFDKPVSMMTVPVFVHNVLKARISFDSFQENDPFTDEDLEIASLFARQVEVYLERQQHEKKLIEEKDKYYELAMFDSLTGLPNRLNTEIFFDSTCNHSKKSGETRALVYLNVKKFKDLNAIFGRSVGDEILQSIAKRLEEGIKHKEFAARFESDEFIFFMPYTDKGNLNQRVKKLLNVLKEPYHVNQTVISLNFKTGISLFPDDGDDFNTLFKNAGIAAVQKENSDDEITFFKKKQVNKIIQRMFMEQRLKQAIEKPGSFQMVYQPCVSLNQVNSVFQMSKINHLEALIRWTTEDGREVSPSLFIPVAEETGMIHKLGNIIARQIVNQIVEFQAHSLDIPVSMNLSAKELMRNDIVEMLDDILREKSLKGKYMGIEITESALIEDISNSVEKLEAFKKLGMNISIDDFGTGYSSLSYINSFPIDYIKIDKSFVDKITIEENSRSIVKTIISLAESLGAKTIAEGVETREQLDILKDLGCNIIQGYFFYKPMPASSILNL